MTIMLILVAGSIIAAILQLMGKCPGGVAVLILAIAVAIGGASGVLPLR